MKTYVYNYIYIEYVHFPVETTKMWQQTTEAITFYASSSLEFHELGFSFHKSSAENSQRPPKLLPPVILVCPFERTEGQKLIED